MAGDEANSAQNDQMFLGADAYDSRNDDATFCLQVT